jgi:hypothetical protein
MAPAPQIYHQQVNQVYQQPDLAKLASNLPQSPPGLMPAKNVSPTNNNFAGNHIQP